MKERYIRERSRRWVKVSHLTDEKGTEGKRGRGRERWQCVGEREGWWQTDEG